MTGLRYSSGLQVPWCLRGWIKSGGYKNKTKAFITLSIYFIKNVEVNTVTKNRFLKKPIKPVEILAGSDVSELLSNMGDTAFQGKNLAVAVEVWQEMLKNNTTIFMGLAGAMVPAGMRKVVVYLLKNRLIDCLVSTGANLFHDIHETLGKYHWQGTTHVNDEILYKEGIDRMYDVFALEKEFREIDKYIFDFSQTIESGRPYTTREFFYLIGKKLTKDGKNEGIISSAYKADVPIYCPAVADSSIGIALSINSKGENFLFDVVADVQETAKIVIKAKTTGVIYIGGGTPKNFIQQTEVTASKMGVDVPGHQYAIQITADSPHWGGLSGCTFEEAQSWGKIAQRAKKVTVYCDSTIALPIIVTAVSQRCKKINKKRDLPNFKIILKR